MCKTKEEIKSILVIRSAPMHRTFEALKKVREEYPKAEISVLVQEEVKDKIEKTCLRATHRQSGLADKAIVGTKKGRIGLIRNLPLVFRLRKKVFDSVVIIYNTEDISWYANLRLFTSAIRAKEKVGITTENIFQPINVRDVVFRDVLYNLVVLRPFQLIFIVGSIILLIILLIPCICYYYWRRYFTRYL